LPKLRRLRVPQLVRRPVGDAGLPTRHGDRPFVALDGVAIASRFLGPSPLAADLAGLHPGLADLPLLSPEPLHCLAGYEQVLPRMTTVEKRLEDFLGLRSKKDHPFNVMVFGLVRARPVQPRPAAMAV